VVKITTLLKKMALVIKHQGYKVGIVSRVGKLYVLDMPIKCAMLVKLVTD
jgi:hypothetical protein